MQAASVAVDFDAALNENQAAEFLACRRGLSRPIEFRGGGPLYCKIGRAVRYSRRELLSFQRKHTVSSTSDADARIVAAG